MAKKDVVILLVEDDPAHRLLISKVLEENHVRNSVYETEDGQDGLDYVYGVGKYANRQSYPLPDLILLDIKMPRMDGFEVLEKLKSDDTTKHIPIIMLTTSSRDEEVARGYKNGANAYVTKPVDFREFVEKLKNLKIFWVLTTEITSTQ
ncbi:hypothetical protein MNBD_NITROSPINAE02-486 [hydrothermal vent metagenome]|uniref:Response regulatory domain-containing protein n=1 Tax=hydrothermal vent metagenome TaxID=652676 RepID=A0A3B1CQ20_9ZZZZ